MRLVTLVHEMVRRNAQYGLETICGAGGLGVAAVLRRQHHGFEELVGLELLLDAGARRGADWDNDPEQETGP